MYKEKANNARIRDNQRRSRARRKEYIQELEARLRQSELRGIEASAEIQMAARQVADENRKLRGLLSLHGMGDDKVETYLQSSPTGNALVTSQFPSHNTPVQVLRSLLQSSKSLSFCSDGDIGVGMTGIGETVSERSSLARASTAQSPLDLDRFSHSGALQDTDDVASHIFMTQGTTASSTTSSISYHPNHSTPQRRGFFPGPLPRTPSPTPIISYSQMLHHDTQLWKLDPPHYITRQ